MSRARSIAHSLSRVSWLLLLAACGEASLPHDASPDPCGEVPADSDGDGVCDAIDPCPDDAPDDSDGDGACDSVDPCPVDAADDSDGDGVCDSDDTCPGHDDTADADGDGVPDGCDACEGHDDTVDTDGDGVPDGCDACPDDPADYLDSDNDGVCDVHDVCPGHYDDLDADGDGVANACDRCPGQDDRLDADGDGVPDGCDTCEGHDDHLDADGDGVADGCDICEGHDDAADTDGDGTPDGCDLCPDDDPDDPDGDGVCGCAVLNVAVPAQPYGPGSITPAYIGLEIEGIVEGSAMLDFDLAGALTSAQAVFTLFDAALAPLCELRYDLGDPTVLAPTPPNVGFHQTIPVGPYAIWDFTPNNGWTDCPELDLAVGWGPNPANRIEAPPWGLAFGPMLSLDADMQADPVIGPDWASDYAPYVFSLWVWDSIAAVYQELSYVVLHERTCARVDLDGSGEPIPQPAPVVGPLDGWFRATSFHLLPF